MDERIDHPPFQDESTREEHDARLHDGPIPDHVKAPAVDVRGLTKRFGTLIANDSVDFELHGGEVHALEIGRCLEDLHEARNATALALDRQLVAFEGEGGEMHRVGQQLRHLLKHRNGGEPFTPGLVDAVCRGDERPVHAGPGRCGLPR